MTDLLQLIDDLTYRNYAHNRRLAPEVSAESWQKVYGLDVVGFEARYQAEQKRDEEQRLAGLERGANQWSEVE